MFWCRCFMSVLITCLGTLSFSKSLIGFLCIAPLTPNYDAHAHGFWVGTGAILFSWCNSIRHGWAWVGMGSMLLLMGEHGQAKHIERVSELVIE